MMKFLNKIMPVAASAVFALIALAPTEASAQLNIFGNKAHLDPRDKMARAEALIEQFYLDDVDGDKLAEAAIVGMFKTLDPHSAYYTAEEAKEFSQPLDGKFSGIGIQFNLQNDTLNVVQTTVGGPSEKVGILAGDVILQADTVRLTGAKKTNADVLKTLRGEKGSEVMIEVMRRGESAPLKFRIVRDDIPINSVDAYFMADPDNGVGYIRITRFADTTDKEFIEAYNSLFKQGMKHLIIDLEDNGGGYLNSAVKLAEHMLSDGDMITYTEGPKTGRNDYVAKRDGSFRNGRVVVLVNQYSASASEILSGAIQDNDRGLIVGRRTFGKGLVQRPFPFPDGSMAKLTVSRYHTPSGRVIQKPYELGDEEAYQKDMANRYENGEFMNADSIHFPDSLRYETIKNHRTVYGGGGIMPDVFVPIDTMANTRYYRELVAKGIISNFCYKYVNDNRKVLNKKYPDIEKFIPGFAVTDEMMTSLTDMATKEEIEFNQEQYDRSKDMLRVIVKGLIGRDLYDSSAYARIVYPELNDVYKSALDLINDPKRYRRLLNGE